MRPLEDWPADQRRLIRGVFTDIDDTLTTHGSITPDALEAIAALRASGRKVIAITGRHIGWCERLMDAKTHAPWPVDAMVAENGGVALISDKNTSQPAQGKRKALSKIYQRDAAWRDNNQARMQAVAERVLREVPGVALARDEGGRETDLAFDHAEFASLSPAMVQHVVDILKAEGMHTTVSSIHIHGCFGDFTKWTGAQWIVRKLFERNLAEELDQWVFVGDSGNDQPMFQHCIHSVGVANIVASAATLDYLPGYVSRGARGAGFAEVANSLLTA
jgi:hypothetical protein